MAHCTLYHVKATENHIISLHNESYGKVDIKQTRNLKTDKVLPHLYDSPIRRTNRRRNGIPMNKCKESGNVCCRL